MNSTFLPADLGFAGTDAALAAFIVPSADPASRTKTSTDWCFDALTADGFASGTLPASGAVIADAGIVNVANDSPLALPAAMRGAVTATKTNAASPTFNQGAAGATGLVFASANSGTKEGIRVHKAGVADNRMTPAAEGFLDFLVIVWANILPNTAGRLFQIANDNSDGFMLWYLVTDGRVLDVVNGGNRDIAGGAGFGTMRQYAQHVSYNTAGQTITVTNFCDGAITGPPMVSSKKPSDQAAFDQSTMRQALGFYLDGTIARAERIFTGLAGHIINPVVHVANDWAANRARLAGR